MVALHIEIRRVSSLVPATARASSAVDIHPSWKAHLSTSPHLRLSLLLLWNSSHLVAAVISLHNFCHPCCCVILRVHISSSPGVDRTQSCCQDSLTSSITRIERWNIVPWWGSGPPLGLLTFAMKPTGMEMMATTTTTRFKQ